MFYSIDVPNRRNWLRKLTAFTTAVIFAALLLRPAAADPATALENYVNTPDPAFAFAPIAPGLTLPGLTVHILQVNSQQWRSPEEVDRTLWQHFLTMFVPDTVISDVGMLFVLGSDNDDGPPDLTSDVAQALAQFALASQTVVSVIQQVPNQPLFFADDPIPNNSRREDELVAFTFDRATRTGDYNWPAYLPMVKSVVRAMDAVQAYVPTVTTPTVELNRFVVAGFSKRGATAWLTAAIDERVIAVAPGVIDVLNWAPSLENHRAAYGFFSDALVDYLEFDLLDRLRTPEGQELLSIIDPYSYRDRLTLPKYIINASGDEFFPPDSSKFYFDDLPGEALIRYLPNTNHDGDEGGFETALFGMLAWFRQIIADAPRPRLEWSLDAQGRLHVTTAERPLQALLWQATNPLARDFRFDEPEAPNWIATPLEPVNGEYIAEVTPPASGWTAYFVELAYAQSLGLPQVYSTQVFITPDETPFPLDQPINNPRSALFWSQEFAAALGDAPRYSPTFTADTLRGFLPLRVFNQYVSTLEEAHAALQLRGNVRHHALRQCLAVRLNIEAEQIDWYSRVRFLFPSNDAFLWKRWNRAHEDFLANRPAKAAVNCASLNFQ